MIFGYDYPRQPTPALMRVVVRNARGGCEITKLVDFPCAENKESVCKDANTLRENNRNIQVLFLVQVVLSGYVYSRIHEFDHYIRCPFSCLA